MSPEDSTSCASPELMLRPIGRISSGFQDKFGTPRQSGLCPALTARLIIDRCPQPHESVRGLEDFSHIWILSWMHRNAAASSPLVRPPRLGGNAKVGVFASRAPVRPNPIALSAVELLGVELLPGCAVLHIRGADLVDETPVLDVKPYIPYCDALPQARAGWVDALPPSLPLKVEFAAAAAALPQIAPSLAAALEQILALDPAPAYHEPGRRYTFTHAGREVSILRLEGLMQVLDVQPWPDPVLRI